MSNMDNPRYSRKRAIKNQINRLSARLSNLREQSRRYSWYRLATILAGLLLIFASIYWVFQYATLVLGIFFLTAFSVIVYFHRQLDHRISKYEILKRIKEDQIARMELDWDNITSSSHQVTNQFSPLEFDLDLMGEKSLHRLIDTSISKGGSRLLADWLTHSTPDINQIDYRQRIVNELMPLVGFRDKLLITFHQVSNDELDGKVLLKWLHVEYTQKPTNRLLPILAVLAILNISLFVMNFMGLLPPIWMLTLLIYIGIYMLNHRNISGLLEAVDLLDRELEKFRNILQFLGTYQYRKNQYLIKLCEPFTHLKGNPSSLLKKIKIITAAVGLRNNPITAFLLNLLVPWDFLIAHTIQTYRTQVSSLFPLWLDTFYELEALTSFATFSYLNPEYRFPVIHHGPDNVDQVFKTYNLGHPLIPFNKKISNDMYLRDTGETVIITGSNMAGKTTFIKTVGINLCLAYAGGPVSADLLITIPFRLHTCINISDSITDGYSYFYAEVKCLKKLLDKINSQGEYPVMYLIDEMFRGTNNRERMLGSQAYVNSLINTNGIGFIATHDLELANLADHNSHIHNYHFQDEISNGILIFDYKIHPGKSSTTNALNIMSIEGLPV